ncbi:MAG: protein phosphatase 2C domain-containing protein [Myxococcota bacterium]|nr:protein phosphatase 2C domain-containing protein [Myxococcota bacterium]
MLLDEAPIASEHVMEVNQDPKVYTAPILENLEDCTVSAHSNVGTVRSENQDFMGFIAFEGYRLLVVCDGMGGHSGGYEASRMAVEAILAHVPAHLAEDGIEKTLNDAIETANETLQAFAKENPQFKGMGTTAVMCLMKDGQVWLAHVGDSRAYLIREGEVRLLTYDHTCINRLVLMGKVSYEDSIDHPIGHILERSVGVERTVLSEVSDEEIWLQKGDQILLCSDGFSGLVVDDDISSLCQADFPLHERVAKMIEFSLERYADDNVTIGVLEYLADGFPDKPVPEDKREQLKNIKLDFDAIADLETADPPETLDPLPNLSDSDAESETGPYLVNEPDNNNTLIVLFGVLVVLVLGFSLFNQEPPSDAPIVTPENVLAPPETPEVEDGTPEAAEGEAEDADTEATEGEAEAAEEDATDAEGEVANTPEAAEAEEDATDAEGEATTTPEAAEGEAEAEEDATDAEDSPSPVDAPTETE